MAPPIYVKGGAWTNVEDEILKAAISKYGLTQWDRVSSLLPKKSSKQVKARWFEYLFPLMQGGTATWSKQDDTKLLQLIKVFPNQWRSIAPLLNKTPTQCIERYQKLLDDVTGIDLKVHSEQLDDLGLSGPGVETLPATGPSLDELHNPETLPSMPADMDDDREMLSEAKARLANTLGKKAKRKARERMLDESKRIALLQKRREMKAAGFNVSLETTAMKKKRNKEFDYVDDIVNEHAPKLGLYDTLEELQGNTIEKTKSERTISKEGLNVKALDDKKKRKAKAVADEKVEVTIQKKRKLELSQPGQLGDRSEPNGLLKSLSKLLKSKLSELPKPKNENVAILPILEGEEIVTIPKEDDAGERYRNLEILRKVSEEQAKLRRSQVVQRGLVIPSPENLRKLNDLPLLELLIQDELHKLVKSDYSEYDSSYNAVLVEDIDEEIWEEVQKRLEVEINREGKEKMNQEGKEKMNKEGKEKMNKEKLNKEGKEKMNKEGKEKMNKEKLNKEGKEKMNKEGKDAGNEVVINKEVKNEVIENVSGKMLETKEAIPVDKLINRLLEYHNQILIKEEKFLSLVHFKEFSKKENTLLNKVHQMFNDSVVIEQELQLVEGLVKLDGEVSEKTSRRLQEMVDEVVGFKEKILE